MYYSLLRRVSVTHVAYFSVISTTGTRYAPPRHFGRAKSERSSPVDVGLSKIYSFPPTRDCRPLWRGPTTAGERRRGRSQMKVTRYCVNNSSTYATNGAWRKTAKKGGRAGGRIADKRFFIGQWGTRKNVIAPAGRIHAAPQFLAAIRHTLAAASRTNRVKKINGNAAAYDFSSAIYSISKTFFHITGLLDARCTGVDLFPTLRGIGDRCVEICQIQVVTTNNVLSNPLRLFVAWAW